MSDLLVRLADSNAWQWEEAREAYDEIERLRGQRDRLLAAITDHSYDRMGAPVDWVLWTIAAEVRAEVERLRATMAKAVEELDAEHRPMWAASTSGYTFTPVEGRAPAGCAACYPGDSSWPCVSRQVTDDLRAALGEDR